MSEVQSRGQTRKICFSCSGRTWYAIGLAEVNQYCSDFGFQAPHDSDGAGDCVPLVNNGFSVSGSLVGGTTRQMGVGVYFSAGPKSV